MMVINQPSFAVFFFRWNETSGGLFRQPLEPQQDLSAEVKAKQASLLAIFFLLLPVLPLARLILYH
jgi:hypothetical protein